MLGSSLAAKLEAHADGRPAAEARTFDALWRALGDICNSFEQNLREESACARQTPAQPKFLSN